MIGKAWFKNWLSQDDSQPESSEQLNEQLVEQAKRLAYREIFKQSRFAGGDGLNEYDLDYTGYAERGDLTPVEMQQALARLEQYHQSDEVLEKQQENGDMFEEPHNA